MATLKPNLIVVAHPDDETIFFAGLIQSERRRPWHVVCATDGNADGRGVEREGELRQAANRLKVKEVLKLGLADRFDRRLDQAEITRALKEIGSHYHTVYTHGILGEYGHPHHQDVSFAVHRVFADRPVWSVAYNCLPQRLVRLTAAQFRLKCELLASIYRRETERFMHLLPATAVEAFVRLEPGEVAALFRFVAEHRPLDIKALRVYRWLAPILTNTAYSGLKRPF